MASSENKTVKTRLSPTRFVKSIEHPVRQADAVLLLGWFKKVTGLKPIMWGNTMVGYGRYYYKYESGREGESFITGFSPRKAAMSVYIMPGYQDMEEKLGRLGKHKHGKSCLYINKLADIELAVLEEIVVEGVEYMRANYKTWDS